MLLSDSTKSDNAILFLKKTSYGPTVVSSSSIHKQRNNDRVVVEEVDSRLRYDVVDLIGKDEDRREPNVVDLVEDNNDRILIRDLLASITTTVFLSICGPRLEFKDGDLKEEETQLRENCLNP